MFKKVLVANRGEIAVRIIQTLKEMGIQSVAIYSTADAQALHVQLADEAIAVGGPQAADSYLNMQNILSAALMTGAEAIHPGYGFLAENDMFAEMVTSVGIKWIGPSAEVIALMGNKANAREAMQKADVPVIPGSTGTVESVDEAQAIAAEIGYPVLLKAAAGGGGKGIRLVESSEDLADAFTNGQREAEASFGDHSMYVEKVLTNVRHIEMQVSRDQTGHAVYFPERDCSLQRHKQKLIEESPATGISPEQRRELGQITLNAVHAIDYENTGTIEFLQDDTGAFYFLEMNTRIQVEHPVTELVTGIDLIRLQIEVAAGETIPWEQADVQVKGHAIECRINAEQPEKGFLPSAGPVNTLYLPTSGPNVRFDTALYPGDIVQPYYDAMILKALVWAPTRELALVRMRRVLDEIIIDGLQTNIAFQRWLLDNPKVQSGQFDIAYVEAEVMPRWKEERAN